jgi:error-prone DNA polymerase
MTESYVELHAHSAFSFLEGASVPEDLAAACAEFGMPAMALVDRNGVYGAPRFHQAAKKAGIRAHIGSEITCTNGLTYPLLVETREGYQNLCRLVTRMKLRAKKGEGAATLEELAEFARGLICLTRHPDARLLELFGKHNVYAELQRHHHRDEEARNQAIVESGFPLVATNGVAYATAAERELLDVLTCVRQKVTLSTAGRLLERNSERYVKTPAQMARLFADLPEAIAHTLEISSRLQFTLADLGYQFPRYPVPEGETQISFLRKRVDEGARRRYQPYHERARRQIERELALIEKLKLPGYFLIVWDIVRFCQENSILAQGRGSAANSAVCYSLEITAVDPVGMDLLFERFLSEERGEWPDIDLDLPSGDKRERVIQYVYQRFGGGPLGGGAAMTANVITYRGRSAAREVGKALGFEVTALDRLSGLVRTWEWKDPKDSTEAQFRDAGLDLAHPRVRKFFELYRMAQDLPRHLGQHSGGMVICQGQLDSVVPLEPASMPGRVVVQWDKEDCADMGIIKVDLLGLGMMAVIEDCLKLVPEVDLARLPADDPAVFKALQKADTIGMFQVESRAQMSALPRMMPRRFYDIVVQVAIIRPGPIVGKMVHPYLNRRQGREAPDCLHPSLEPVLKRTLGVPLFQEQLLRMAMIAAGFTGGEAEELRRAMGFKRSEKRMAEIEVKLRAGMERTGIRGKVQDDIVRSITSFALYGFPESHAASFALLAYASAYLKCHHLAAFTCAMLNNQPMGFYSPAILIKDAQRHGLRVLPVDVTKSEWNCTLEPAGGTACPTTVLVAQAVPPAMPEVPCLRLGLRYARGLREEAARAILRARPFSSIDDLAFRVRELRKDEIKRLAEIGALNSLDRVHRRDALWQTQRATLPVGPLLAPLEESGEPSPLVPMNTEERLHADYHGTGVTIGQHPMAYRRAEMNTRGVTRAIDLAKVPNGRLVRIAGAVIVRQRPGTAHGFVFMSMEDETGIMNAIVAPATFDRYKFVVLAERYLVIDGVLQNLDGVISVKAGRIEPLHAGAAPSSHNFH